jgi:hypothetical protein
MLAVGMASTLLPGKALAVEVGDFELNGYVRQYLSFNLDDVPETGDDDKYDLSMNRLQVLMQLQGKVGKARMTVIGRVVREQITNYLQDLEDLVETPLPSGAVVDADFKDEYDDEELREFYLDIPVGERINLRLGKQQVVWGETDFFQAMDVVHGYDQTWRSFLEPENEEWRKPLILANANISIPELNGTLQLLARPGFDDEEDIGNSYDMFGGRWSQNGSRGFDLNAVRPAADVALGIPSLPFDFHHSEGDTDDAHYGGRWSGTFGPNDDVSYSLNYYHTQSQNPVLFPSERTPSEDPMGLAFVYPEIDIFGGTLSGYIPFIDSVYRIEVAYTPDHPINNINFEVMEKDFVRAMLGLDTNLRLQTLIGTSNASMLSLQVFNTYIDNFDKEEKIINAFGTTEDKNTTWVTGIFTLPYKMDTITGQLVAVHDTSNGGGVLAPSVEFQFGPSWRVKFEGDLFYGGKRSDGPGGATLFGSFDHADQFLTRVTYQF